MNWITSSNVITLDNLPLNLNKLVIRSHIPIIINNLPHNLNQLTLSNSKFNLEYLPEKLKILNLENIEDLANLLVGLEKIRIGVSKFYSVKELFAKI